MKPRPKPLLGLLLGFLLGLVVVGLLWQLGVAPPDRFILFGVLAVTILVVELLLTQTTRRGKKRFVTSAIIAGVLGGVALTGIPETFLNTGTLSEGCSLTVASATDEATPTDTSAFDAFDTTPDDSVEFTSSTDTVLTNWDSGLGTAIGGIPITIWTAERANAEGLTEWAGTEPVSKFLDDIEDQSGLQLRGTYHAFGYINADEGDCEMAGYIRVNAEGVFATPLIIGLWVAGGLLLLIVIALAFSVRRSLREAGAEAVATETRDAEYVGAFTSAEPEPASTPEPEPAREPKDTKPAATKESRGNGSDKAAAGTSAAWLASEEREPVADTQVMPAADTELLPVTEDEAPDELADAVEGVAPSEPQDEPEPQSEDAPEDQPEAEPEPPKAP
ncbi:hypothetical protein [Demequina sp.]|uniref:hypothetical protein n=1 Tax=Demequina sp. TaxID=2050685 RepID=UPI003D140703